MPRGARKKSPFFWGMINLPVIEWSKTPATDYQCASLMPLHADLDILAKKTRISICNQVDSMEKHI
jgi:hypothetical protein